MRLLIDLFRAADGRLEGVVHAPGAGGTAFAGILDLLRVLEEIDLRRSPTGPDTDTVDGREGDA
jgi:hypothetical protein